MVLIQAPLSDDGLGFINSLQVLSESGQRAGPKDTGRCEISGRIRMSLVCRAFEHLHRLGISGQGDIQPAPDERGRAHSSLVKSHEENIIENIRLLLGQLLRYLQSPLKENSRFIRLTHVIVVEE